MLSMINIADPREIIVIGMTRVTSAEEGTRLLAIDQDERATSPLDQVIEPGVDRTFAALIAKDNFSAAGALEYRNAAIAIRVVEDDDGMLTGEEVPSSWRDPAIRGRLARHLPASGTPVFRGDPAAPARLIIGSARPGGTKT
jgi:hypothetical protein